MYLIRASFCLYYIIFYLYKHIEQQCPFHVRMFVLLFCVHMNITIHLITCSLERFEIFKNLVHMTKFRKTIWLKCVGGKIVHERDK